MNIKQYLQSVVAHIRSKEAKVYVEAELAKHMEHSKMAWMTKGYTETDAEDKAASEMGSPIELGKSLNKVHKPKIDWLLLSLFIGILFLSFLPILALHQPQYESLYGYYFNTMIRNKILYIIIGIILAIALMYFDYRKFAQWGYIFYGIASLFIIFLYVFHNTQINGEVMFELGPIRYQMWMAIPLYCIAWAALFTKKTFTLWQAIVLLLLSIFLFSYIANLSVLFIYSVLVGVLFMYSKYSRKQKVIVVGAVVTLIISYIIFMWLSYQNGIIENYQIARLLGYLNPSDYAYNEGYMYVLLDNLLKGAKWFGSGTSHTIPTAHTDLVLGHLIQSYGLALALGLVLLLSLFVVRFIRISSMTKHSFGRLLIIGCITIFSTQFIYTVAMTLGVVPIVSLSLPFLSYGFMPTVLNSFLLGLVLSVYRRKNFIQDVSFSKLNAN